MDERAKAKIREMVISAVKNNDEKSLNDMADITVKLANDLAKLPGTFGILQSCMTQCNDDVDKARAMYNEFVLQLILTEAFKK